MHRVIFETQYAQLRDQQDYLTRLRTQAAATAALASIAASVFSGIARDNERMDALLGFDGFGFSCLSFSIFFCIFLSLIFSGIVLAGWGRMEFEISSDYMLWAADNFSDEKSYYSDLAKKADGLRHNNETRIEHVQDNVTFAVFLAVAQVPLWLLLILGK